MMLLIARGNVRSGLAVSAATKPITSTPAKVNAANGIAYQKPLQPFGKNPPCRHRWVIEGGCDDVSSPNSRIAKPAAISPTIVTTLINASQNSTSPNVFTANKLITINTTVVTNAGIHCANSGNQYFINKPIPVTSSTPTRIQINQYDHPVINATRGPKNSSAYVANDPLPGRYNDNSPSARAIK